MREIIFKGKTRSDKWVEGSLLIHKTLVDPEKWTYEIIGKNERCATESYWVIPETIGQYIGLPDKNGKKIFEGDIVKATITYNNFPHDRTDNVTAIFEVKYHEKHCYFYLARKNYNMLFDGNWNYYLKEIKVIGNIHDNPELLGVDKNEDN